VLSEQIPVYSPVEFLAPNQREGSKSHLVPG
jgi:hypothetical protein